MNHKKPDSNISSKNKCKKYNAKTHHKQDTALVSVGMNKTMKCEYWSKKPGQKARYISLPARQPFRKGPTRSKTINGYNRKPTYGKHMVNNQGDHQVNNKYPY